MAGTRSHGRVSRALAAAFAATLAAGTAIAQDGPVILAPPKPLAAPTAAPAASGTAAGPAESAPVGIKADTLGEIDANSVGVLDAGGGGFGIGMWRGTPRALVETLLPTLTGAPQSVTGRSLYRRLLLSAAETPAGAAGKDGPSLVAMRVGRLLAQGDVAAAQNLLRVVPNRIDDPAIALARAEVALLMNDNAGACAETRSMISEDGAVFWRKAQIFCQLLAGDSTGAGIGAGLLQEQGVDDAPFFALARMLGGDKGVAVNGLDKPSPLHLAMMRAARVQIPAAAAVEATPVLLRAVALSPNADLDTRLEAAERAEERGALETEALRQLYLSVNFTPDELSGALSGAPKLSGPRGRALLFRALRGQNVAAAKAEIIASAFGLARKQGRLPTAIRVMLPILAGVEPSEDLSWFAAEAGSALYFAGDAPAAAKWVVLAQAKTAPRGDRTDGAKLAAAQALWPMAALAALAPVIGNAEGKVAAVGSVADASAPLPGQDIQGQGASTPIMADAVASARVLDAAAFERWWKAAVAYGEEVRIRRAIRILSLAEALGATVPDASWALLVHAPSAPAVLPSPGLMAGLKRAAAAGRVGETVLLALAALGTENPAKIDIRVLAPVVRALREAGLEEPAHRLAVEAVYDDQI